MSIIPEVKCRRCGESFSSMRSRCPNCGTRRVSQSGRTPGTTPGTVQGTASYERATANTKWQMIFGLILVVAVILAVIVMVSTSIDGSDSPVKTTPSADVQTSAQPTPELAPTPPPTPTPTVETISIRYYEDVKTEFTMYLGDEPVPLNALVTPATITDKVTWSSADESKIVVTADSENPNNCIVEIMSTFNGGCKIYAELHGKKAECIVYCGG